MGLNQSSLSGNEWQIWANQLLTCRYGPEDYQTIPDKDRGDGGLEGFCPSNGYAYQAYGCEEPVTVQIRYQKQRDKMTADIQKFINNSSVISNILGKIKIKRWILFVPIFDSKSILEHASKKTEDVFQANLSYVDNDFRVIVCQEKDFSTERNKLINAQNYNLKVNGGNPPNSSQIDIWSESNSDLIITLNSKLCKINTLQDDSKRNIFLQSVLKWYLNGQIILGQLRNLYPQIYEKVIEAKSHRERFLVMNSIQSLTANDILINNLNDMKDALGSEAKELHIHSAEELAYEAIADWLLRCPLDFP